MADAPSWLQIDKNFVDAPDAARDAARVGYFDSVMWPKLVQAGVMVGERAGYLQDFLTRTERSDKASMPRLKTTAASAAAALVRPVASVVDQATNSKEILPALNKWEADIAGEAQKQGINPAPYQMAGGFIGAAAPFALAAGPISAGARALGVGAKAAELLAATGGGAAYEAAAAEPGKRTEGAIRGGAMGAALGGLGAMGGHGVGIGAAAGGIYGAATGQNPLLTSAIGAALPLAAKMLVRLKTGQMVELPPEGAAAAVKSGAGEVVPPKQEVPQEVPRSTGVEVSSTAPKTPEPEMPPAGRTEVIPQDAGVAPQAAAVSVPEGNAAVPPVQPAAEPIGQAPPSVAAGTPEPKPTAATVNAAAVQPIEGPAFTPGSIMELPTNSIVSDPKFQFSGERASIPPQGQYNPQQAGAISVWLNPKDSQVYVVDGFKRLQMARENGVPTQIAHFLKAGDANEAALQGSFLNLVEGTHPITDAIELFNRTNITPAEFQEAIHAAANPSPVPEEAPAQAIPQTEAAIPPGPQGQSPIPGNSPTLNTATPGSAAPGPGNVIPMRERPSGTLGSTGGAPIPGAPPEAIGATWKTGPGQASSVFRVVNRDNVFHESLHRSIIQNGIPDAESVLGGVDPKMSADLGKAIPSDLYQATPHEEVFVRLQTAVRTGNEAQIDAFARADSGKENVLDFAVKQAQSVQSELSKTPDGPARRMGERKLQDTIRRANRSLEYLRAQVELNGAKLDMDGGRLKYTEPGSKTAKVFSDINTLHEHLDKQPAFPEAPEFVPASEGLPGSVPPPPSGGPNYARYNTEDVPPPIGKPAPGTPGSKPLKVGIGEWLSYFVTPKLDWVSRVASRHNWPELYSSIEGLDTAAKARSIWLENQLKDLHEILKPYPMKRMNDFWEYLTAKEQHAAGKLNDAGLADAARNASMGEAELKAMEGVRGWLNNLGREFNIDPSMWIAEYLPRLRKADYSADMLSSMSKSLPENLKFFAEMARTGELDHRENNLATLLYNYARLGSRKKFMEEPYQAALDVLEGRMKVQDQFGAWTTRERSVPVAQELQTLLKRHLEFMIDRPDQTQKLIENSISNMIDHINVAMAKAHNGLPAWMSEGRDAPQITALPRDVLTKITLMQYAGGIGFRPGRLIGDMTQMFLAYPMLGEKYFAKGAAGSFNKELRLKAEKYGVIQGKGDVLNHLAGGGEIADTGRISGLAQMSLEPQRRTSNMTRLIAFNGFLHKIGNAVTGLQKTGNVERFITDSGLQWLKPQMRGGLMMEMMTTLQKGGAVDDVVAKMAMRLTERSQWSFTKGAQAGGFQYQLGRIFGQYGTWPTNYVEYMRDFFRSDIPKTERMKAGARFMAVNSAILSTGQALGFDMTQLVFTQPGAFAGGPWAQALLNAPTAAFDWDSQKGKDARRAVASPAKLMIPGAVQWGYMYDALADNKGEDAYKYLLGMPVMTKQKESRPLHQAASAVLGE